MEITFDNLPKAVANLSDEISEIKRLLLDRSVEDKKEADQWFNIAELRNYLPDKPAKPTVYGWVQDGLIPCHKGGKKLRFLKSEIDSWLKQGRKKTNAEIEAEAETYLAQKEKGSRYGK